MPSRIRIGTAGWSIPRSSAHRAAADGTHLQRYARLFPCAEINSAFHRPHASATYAKWAMSTPADFRFAVKIPRAITHDLKLRGTRLPLEKFFELIRARDNGAIVCEPRHGTWLSREADALLVRYHVARVAADPAPAPGAEFPGGWKGVVYYRLHGAPRKYWSPYGRDYLAALAHTLCLVPASVDAWCVFDNTASGAAIENALDLQALVTQGAVQEALSAEDARKRESE